ncbi:hypothetical protein [Acinetobacter bereziniae]|uniref:hypothetical protein n=1 Tax=Acinetobacter bereziniae TaxID=106648 RepID=UPI0015DBACA8|nr:hypothetical protein [Acinetobacter bereziniae]
MEKILRLLNPKSTNFDSVGGGSYGALTTQDVCAAITYAKLSVIETELFNLYVSGSKTIEMIEKSISVIHKELLINNETSDDDFHKLGLFVVLVEMFCCAGDYKPSVRNRAMIAGVSKDKMHRVINQYVENLRVIINVYSNILSIKINNQISK